VYDYGSNSVEQFDRVYNRTGATRYPVVDIEPPYVNAPHYNGAAAWERYSKFIAPLSVWCNWLAWTPVLAIGCGMDQQNQELRERNYSTFIRGGAGINCQIGWI
jgi:hypothetical protein